MLGRVGSKPPRSGAPAPRLVLETLEPRLLLSADPFTAHLGDAASLLPGAPHDEQAVADALAELSAAADGAAAEEEDALRPTPDPDEAQSRSHEAALSREIVFVDAGVADRDALIADLLRGGEREIRVVVLEADRDGVAQISEALAGLRDLDAVHVVSHGDDGSLRLGATVLDGDSLGRYADAIRGWGYSLDAQADLLFYGCNLAAGDDGRALVGEIAALTGADVAASEDLTGSAALGGDWQLEHHVGAVDTQSVFSVAAPPAWESTLAIINVTTTSDLIDGGITTSIADLIATPGSDGISLREAIIAANATAGDDVIVLGAGVYELAIGGTSEDAGASGDLDIASNITISGAGMGATIIDANGIDRVFHVTDSASHVVLFHDLTITGGSVSGHGGGLLIEAADPDVPSVTLDKVRITDNHTLGTGSGGGIYVEGIVQIVESRIDSNTSATTGGGMRIVWGSDSGAVDIVRSTIDGNTAAASGGGIANNGPALDLVNTTVSGNTGSIGGGIFSSKDFSLTHVTLVNNTATAPGGAAAGIHIQTGGITATLLNTILADNVRTDLVKSNSNAPVLSLGNNIDTDGTAGLAGPGDQSGTIAIPLDVNLGPLQDNGGSTPTHALLAGSIAIDAGGSARHRTRREPGRRGLRGERRCAECRSQPHVVHRSGRLDQRGVGSGDQLRRAGCRG
jgi:hypothetical protein